MAIYLMELMISSISGPDELVRVRSTATFHGVKHTSIAEARADRYRY